MNYKVVLSGKFMKDVVHYRHQWLKYIIFKDDEMDTV